MTTGNLHYKKSKEFIIDTAKVWIKRIILIGIFVALAYMIILVFSL